MQEGHKYRDNLVENGRIMRAGNVFRFQSQNGPSDGDDYDDLDTDEPFDNALLGQVAVGDSVLTPYLTAAFGMRNWFGNDNSRPPYPPQSPKTELEDQFEGAAAAGILDESYRQNVDMNSLVKIWSGRHKKLVRESRKAVTIWMRNRIVLTEAFPPNGFTGRIRPRRGRMPLDLEGVPINQQITCLDVNA